MEFSENYKSIENYLPQRKPFLFVDRIVSFHGDEKSLFTEFFFHEDLWFFKGHFPDRPVVPGVILQEAIFQSGAILMNFINQFKNQSADTQDHRVGVISRVYDVKYKKMILPQTLVGIEIVLKDQMGEGFLFSGKMKSEGKTVLTLEFMATLA